MEVVEARCEATRRSKKLLLRAIFLETEGTEWTFDRLISSILNESVHDARRSKHPCFGYAFRNIHEAGVGESWNKDGKYVG